MFPLETISEASKGAFSCRSKCHSAAEAEQIRASFIGPVRQIHMFADLFCEGSTLVIESPDPAITEKIANILNHAVWEN